jgi:hypothetical protein
MKKFIIIIISLGLHACSLPKKLQPGKQVITQIVERGPGYAIVKFEGYKKNYRILFDTPKDTLKVNDTIPLNIIGVSAKKRR